MVCDFPGTAICLTFAFVLFVTVMPSVTTTKKGRKQRATLRNLLPQMLALDPRHLFKISLLTQNMHYDKDVKCIAQSPGIVN